MGKYYQYVFHISTYYIYTYIHILNVCMYICIQIDVFIVLFAHGESV